MNSWTPTPLRDLVTHAASGPSPTSEERPVRECEWGLLKTTAVSWEHGWRASAHKVPPKQYWGNRSLEIHPGDVIVTKAGPRHRVGVAAYVDSTPPRLMVSGKMVLLRPDPSKVFPPILALALATPLAQKYLDHRTTGMAESQVNFSNAALLSCPLPLPPLEEQLRIAEIVSAIDEAIRSTEGVIAKLTSVRHGALNAQMTALIDARDTNILPLKDSMNAPVCYGIVQPGPAIRNGVPMVTIRDLNGDFRNLHRVSRHLDNQYARSRVHGGDVLLSIKGTIGRTAVVVDGFAGNISRDVARLRPTPKLIPEFLEAYLRSDMGQGSLSRVQVGTTRAEVSIGVLAQLGVPVPKLADQRKVINLDAAASDRLKAEMAYLRSLEQTRQGLAYDLLSGRVRTVAS